MVCARREVAVRTERAAVEENILDVLYMSGQQDRWSTMEGAPRRANRRCEIMT
jgi:hypothetical protein